MSMTTFKRYNVIGKPQIGNISATYANLPVTFFCGGWGGGGGGGARWSGGAKVLGKLLVPGRLDYLFGLK